MDVLFLSIAMGAGHLKAAEAIKETVERRYPGARTLIVDTFRYINPIVDKLIVGGYLNTLKSSPQIYGKLYELSETGDNMNDFSKAVNKLLSFRIKNLVNEFNPSIIVCTHPFPMQMLSNLKKKGKINVPIVGVITDFVVHPFWVHDNADAFIVAHEYMKQDMIRKGISGETVHTFGIPVSANFLHKKPKELILRELGFDNRTTCLIMGGSLGFGEIKDTFESLLNCRKDLQIVVVTGKNLKLKRQLEFISKNTKKRVKILSYTSRIADIMDISDFIITKPGGMTVSEALIKQLPMFIISPIPGQEERNAHFLINMGAAIRLLENDDMDHILSMIMDNPLRLQHMKEMAGQLARPYSSEHITSLLGEILQSSNDNALSASS